MATAQKKSVVRERHERAIMKFKEWLKINQDAPPAIKVYHFDWFCDNEK